MVCICVMGGGIEELGACPWTCLDASLHAACVWLVLGDAFDLLRCCEVFDWKEGDVHG